MSHTPSQQRPPKKYQPEVVHSIGEVYAPRFWTYDDEYLYGPSRGIRWPHDRPLEAEIQWGGFQGVYAWKALYPICEWLVFHQTLPVIIGEVQLWGSVIEHGIGPEGQDAAWRAQFGRVHTIDIKVVDGKMVPEDDHIRHLRKNYGV